MTPTYQLCPDRASADSAVRALVEQGWRVAREFRLPEAPWDLSGAKVVGAGLLTGPQAAEAALLAAVRGTSLVVALGDGADWSLTPWARELAADLDRLTRQRGPTATESPAESILTDEQRAVLDLLVEGESIAAASRKLFLSLRTTNRRVAESRAALGVPTTREAVLAYARLTGRLS